MLPVRGGFIFLTLFFTTRAYDCFHKCNHVWSKGVEIENSEFHNYFNNSKNNDLHKIIWRWTSEDGDGLWEVFYNNWSHKGVRSGGFYYFGNKRQKHSYVNWKLTDKILLTWTSEHKKLPFESWNLTLCDSNVRIYFNPSKYNWTFHLGNIRIPGGESGKIFVNENFFEPNYGKIMSRHSKLKRHRRDEPDAEKVDVDPSVWNRLKNYFKELFDNGPNDQRGWMTRIADWILGFLERILS